MNLIEEERKQLVKKERFEDFEDPMPFSKIHNKGIKEEEGD